MYACGFGQHIPVSACWGYWHVRLGSSIFSKQLQALEHHFLYQVPRSSRSIAEQKYWGRALYSTYGKVDEANVVFLDFSIFISHAFSRKGTKRLKALVNINTSYWMYECDVFENIQYTVFHGNITCMALCESKYEKVLFQIYFLYIKKVDIPINF